MNQPPPLEYPATKHPDNPKVAKHPASKTGILVPRMEVGSFSL
jgi:hypothetical protein